MADTPTPSTPPGTPVTNVYVQQPRKRRWWIAVVIAVLVVLVVLLIARIRRDDDAESTRSGDVPATVAPGGGSGSSGGSGAEEPDTTPPEDPSAGEAARSLVVSQLSACGIEVSSSSAGGESREANFYQVTVTTPDDSAVFLVDPATNEIRAGDANGDRYIGMCGL
jgi:hypothetical protein